MNYWERRQQELNKAMEKDEENLKKRLSSYFDTEYRKLEKQIAAYYKQYGTDNVIQYRRLMESLPDADKRLLIEQMDEFAKKYPQYAHLMPIRESIYKLNRLEGLQYSVRMQQLEIGAVENEQITEHLNRQAMRGANVAAETMGFGKNFYSNNPDITKLFVDVPWSNGENFSQKIWNNTAKLANYLNSDIAQGIARGDSYDRLVRRLRERFSNVSRNDAYRLIYTEGTYVMAESTIQPFTEDFEKYRLSTVGDGKVCDICRGVSEETFDIADRQPGVNFPPLHPWCRCTFTIEVDDWDAWMEDYEKRHGNGEAQKVANRMKADIIDPEDSELLRSKQQYTSIELVKMSREVNNYLNTLNIPSSKWSGRTFVKDANTMATARGVKKKTCDIWLREDADTKTIIHEHLHARSSSWMIKKLNRHRCFEEGACELLAEELCIQNNISYKPTYKCYVDPLREINRISGAYMSDYDFAIDLFNVDMDKREEWLNKIAEKQGVIKKTAIKILIKKVRNGR